MLNQLSDFRPGDKVRLTSGVLHPSYAGRTGTVKKTIKCRNMVMVMFDDPDDACPQDSYDAFPQNVEHIGGA